MKKTGAGLLAAAMLIMVLAMAACTGESAAQSSMPAQEGPASAEASESVMAEKTLVDAENWPVVPTAYGPVKGQTEGGVTSFKGVPFAAPPLGELRFAPPEQPEPWGDTMECFAYKSAAVQVGKQEALTQSEDCLYLNIWAPEDAAEKGPLPVLVFIHGGAYAKGTASLSFYDGTRFAKDGVIQVNVPYRLNAMGFMPSLAAMEEYGTTGNMGTLDQIMALEWVRDNIAAFGGDPGKVTICGESAGAFSVSNMILSPMGAGLFSQAILESGNILGQPILCPLAPGSLDVALVQGEGFATKMKAADPMGQPDLATLRALPAEDLAKASEFSTDTTKPAEFGFFPTYDGMVLPEDPYLAMVRGEVNDVPILAGFNADDGSMFVPNGIGNAAYEKMMTTIFGEDAPAVLERFPVDKEHTATDRARYITTLGLRVGNDVFADELSMRGQDVYFYQLGYLPPQVDTHGLGVSHAMELPFVFDTVPKGLELDAQGEAFKEDLHGRWLNFITTGDPNGGENQHGDDWPLYTVEEKEILVLDETPHAEKAPALDDITFIRELLWGEAAP